MARFAAVLALALFLAAPPSAPATAGKPSAASPSSGRATKADDVTREQVQAFVRTYIDAANRADVTPLGTGFAFALAPVVVRVVVGPDTLQADSALTLVLEKTGGKWRIVHEHMSGQEPEQDQDLAPGDDDQDPGTDEGE